MRVKLTEEQMKILVGMVDLSKAFTKQILHIMRNHGLDKIDGCYLTVSVDPEMLFCTESITFGRDYSDAGKITLTKGRLLKDEPFVPTGSNSAEYELLFADDSIRERMEKILRREKELPLDGLWIGDPRNDYPVDSGWEWDVNDSLS